MQKPLEIIREQGAEAAAAAAGEALNQLLADNAEKPVLLLLSAGSALGLLDYVSAKSIGEHLTVAMLDERFSTDEKINNFEQLQKTDFYAVAFGAEANFFGSLPRIIPQGAVRGTPRIIPQGAIRGVPRPGETMDGLAQRMEKNLRTWKTENPRGKIIATFGMGSDGHTAGIFPFADKKKFDKLFSSDNWMVAYDAGDKHQYHLRVTATLTFIKLVDIGIACVCGPDKKDKLNELISGKPAVNELPAAAWHEIKNVKIFTDLK